MSTKGRPGGRQPRQPRPPGLPLKPLQMPAELDAATVRRQVAMFGYLKRVLVDGDETAPCDAGTAAMLAGMILGQRVAGQVLAGMAQPAAVAESLQWIADQSALWGSLAAAVNRGGKSSPPRGEFLPPESDR